MSFSWANSSQIGFPGILGGLDHGMYYNGFVFYSCEWWTKGYDHTIKGFAAGKSPFSLFIPVLAEGLNALLCDATARGDIHEFSICRNGPKLTYLFFADDCLIFCRSTLEDCHKIQELLGYYEVASGQVINKEKTTFFFSKNTEESS